MQSPSQSPWWYVAKAYIKVGRSNGLLLHACRSLHSENPIYRQISMDCYGASPSAWPWALHSSITIVNSHKLTSYLPLIQLWQFPRTDIATRGLSQDRGLPSSQGSSHAQTSVRTDIQPYTLGPFLETGGVAGNGTPNEYERSHSVPLPSHSDSATSHQSHSDSAPCYLPNHQLHLLTKHT